MIFLFLGFSLAHLEPKLQLFEVDDHGNDDLSHHHLPNFKQLKAQIQNKVQIQNKKYKYLDRATPKACTAHIGYL